MSRLRSRRAVAPVAALTMLPFLDIVFSTIGVFVIVFVLQELVHRDGNRWPTIDRLLVCTSDWELALYPTPNAKLLAFTVPQLSLVFEALTTEGEGIHNLVFAFTRDCIGLRQRFEGEFAKFTALRRSQRDRPEAAWRLTFRPLSGHPEAVEHLLGAWRGGHHD